MGILALITAALKAIGAIPELFKGLTDALKAHTVALIEHKQVLLNTAVSQQLLAKTQEERDAAIKALAASVNK